jgi:K+-sensing histidine kinase KdpD
MLRIYNSVSTNGYGLGLALAKSAVAVHVSQINVR